MNLASLSIKRPTFIFSVLVGFIIVGLLFMSRMQVRMMPDVEYPYVAVNVQYSGAGPAEIETRISRTVENALSSISGIKHINSISQDGNSRVFAEFELSKDSEIALQEVKDKIAEIRRRFPDEIEEPIVQKFDPESRPIMILSLKADLEPRQLYDLANEDFRTELLRVDGIANIFIAGGTRREIRVLVDRNKLDQYDTTLSAISQSIQSNSMNVPIGRISIGSEDVSFRTIGEYRTLTDIENVPIRFRGNDIAISVSDVGRVMDTVVERYTVGRINLKQDGKITKDTTLIMPIFKQSKANEVKISNGVLAKVKELNEKYKDSQGSPLITVVSDNSQAIKDNIADVRRTIFEGILLAIFVVYFFLASWRSTVITALALPNSLIGAFIFMYLFDFSINTISLMSLSLTVGLLIDDAIVVRENIYRHYEEGEEPDIAAQKGTDEVMLAVVATTASVIAVFLPVAFLSGLIGKFLKEFGLTVVFAMSISILDALTIAPMLSAYIIPSHNEVKRKPNFIVKNVSAIVHFLTINWFDKVYEKIVNLYRRIIEFILNNKIKTLAFIAIIFIVSLMPFYYGKIPMNFLPEAESGEFTIAIQTSPDSSLAKTDQITSRVEDIIMAMPESEFAVTSVGNNSRELNVSEIRVRLVPHKKRKLTTEEVKTVLRNQLSKEFDKKTTFSINNPSGAMGGGGKAFSILLYGKDTAQLSEAADKLIDRLKNVDGLVDLATNFMSGKPEYQININPALAKQFGINSISAGTELRAMVEGNTPAVFRVEGVEYDIRVSLEENQRNLKDSFNNLYVYNVNNRRVKVSRVANLDMAEGPTRIYRRDRSRYIEISGNISKGFTLGEVQKKSDKVMKEFFNAPENKDLSKRITPAHAGRSDDMNEMASNMTMAGILSLIFIFMVLASLYESIITPLVIMVAIPLGAVGGIVALVITNRALDMFTMVGIIILFGIVAKNSIILVDYIQQLLIRGVEIKQAIVEAGVTRLRPILMTSFALIGGMLPTALALTEVGKFRQGVGILVIGGIVSSTVLTLLVVPAMFEYSYKFRIFSRKLLGRPPKRKIDL
jgi:hydrophobe/amphiphile efflux-1 (HAE1) family protein